MNSHYLARQNHKLLTTQSPDLVVNKPKRLEAKKIRLVPYSSLDDTTWKQALQLMVILELVIGIAINNILCY